MVSRTIPMRLIILPAIFAIAFLAFSFNTASAEITSTYSAYDWETGQTSLFYYDSNYNEITDPVQIVAYQYVQTTNPNADQSEILNLLQSGDLIVNPETATYTFVAQNEYDYSVPPVPIVPATLKGIEAIPDTQIAAQLFGPHYTEEVIQQIKAAAAGRGVSDSQIMTAAQQQLQAHQQKFGSGYTESSNEIDTAADIMVRLGLPDIRQAPGGQEARQQAIQAAEERWRATQDDDGGFFAYSPSSSCVPTRLHRRASLLRSYNRAILFVQRQCSLGFRLFRLVQRHGRRRRLSHGAEHRLWIHRLGLVHLFGRRLGWGKLIVQRGVAGARLFVQRECLMGLRLFRLVQRHCPQR